MGLFRTFALGLGALSLAACSTLQGQPKLDNGTLVDLSTFPNCSAAFVNAAADGSARNACIGTALATIDRAYDDYESQLFLMTNSGNLTADVLTLGFTSAASLVPGRTTAKIFSIIAAGITGTKAAVDSDILYNSTVPIIIGQMRIERASQKAQILKAESGPLATYPLSMAADDLLAYYQAGTWVNAIVSLSTKTGNQLVACKQAQTQAAQAQAVGAPPPDTNATAATNAATAAATVATAQRLSPTAVAIAAGHAAGTVAATQPGCTPAS